MDPWYKVVTPRKEVLEGRSFDPSELAIALKQVVTGTAPEDYRDPRQFFERTVFTRALTEHAGMVLRRLAGETADTALVLTLITQFGGGKARPQPQPPGHRSAEPALRGRGRRCARSLRDKVELLLAWRRVHREVREGTLGAEFDRDDLAEIQTKVADAEEAAKDEVWGGYRYVVLVDRGESDGLKVIDLGAGHASA